MSEKKKIFRKVIFPLVLADTVFIINMYRAGIKFNYNTFFHVIALVLINIVYLFLQKKFGK
ncbi:hypothetical protein [Clostridium hydrogeniformans]|uniref:hypothetical protein n=1 Tax=Clostridium hydrogeniformans TaxID=349933 RepID=UPI000482AD98|nr:hypothetical protein [Clostridium hydrogeniformans]